MEPSFGTSVAPLAGRGPRACRGSLRCSAKGASSVLSRHKLGFESRQGHSHKRPESLKESQRLRPLPLRARRAGPLADQS
jgi:hypothetical protein